MGKQQSDLDKLYGAVSANFDIGSFEEFSTKMQTPEDRKRFYDAVSEQGFDLGDYDSYERRLGGATEVSSQGSQDTSQTSGQPSGSSEEPSLVKLDPQKEQEFQDWYKRVAEHKGLNTNPDDPQQFYDYRAFYIKEPELAQELLASDKDAHFTDIGKLPGHPTFSNESMYFNNRNRNLAGRWDGEIFIPFDSSKPVVNMETGEELPNYDRHSLNDKRNYDKYTDRATYADVPEQLEARQGVNLGDGVRGISAVDPSSGEVYNVIPEVEVTAPIPFSTNFKNTWENVKTQLQGVDDRLSLVSADTWENLLGKELAQAWYKNVGDRNIDEVRAEAYAELQRLEESIRPVSSIGGSIARGDVIGALSGVINSVAQLGTTALIAVPTAGAGLYTEMVGQSIYDFNKEKSEQLGLSIDELYNQGKAEFATPTFIGILGGSLERIGFRGARQAITAAIRSGVGKRLLKVGLGTQKEGLTELLQYGLEETNRTLADPDASLDDATSSFVQAITSENGLEAYLMGVAGSAAAAGMGGIGSKLIGRDNRAAVEEAGTTIAALNEDLNNPELPANTRAVLEGEQQAAVDQVAEAINNDVAIESSLTPDQQNRINDLTNRVDELQTVISDPAVSDGTREIFESEIESIRAEIDAIVSEPAAQQTADAAQPIEATSEETVIEEAGEPVSSLIDTEVDYNGERGMLIQDGQQLVVRLPRNEEGIVREIEVGNIEELGQTPANEIGIEPAVSEVSVNEAGNFTVRGREYVNTQRNPLSAIKYNEEGQITSVVLRTPEGQQRTFRGRAADDIAYEIHLQEIERNNETATRFEDFINQPEISTEIDNAGLSEITEGETTAIIEPVQSTEQQTIEGGQDAIQVGEATQVSLGSTPGDSAQMDQVVREQTAPEEGQGQGTQTQEIVNEAEQSPVAENDAAQVQQPPIEEATTDIPQPTQRTRAPKGLLKGVSDRLKQTGLATGITVTNSEAITQSLGVDGNNVNGYVDNDGNIVINSDRASVDTPIHELSHVWEQTVERDNPALHTRGMELIQTPEGNPYVEYVRQTQPTLEGPALFKEALAQAIGDRGARLIDSQKQSTLKEWLKRAWEYIGGLVGISGLTADQISNLTLGQYADAVAVDLLSGKPYAKLNNGDIVAKTPAATEQQMDESDRFMADFMTRMKKRNGVNFQASIDGSLSPQDFNDMITFFRYARQKNQIAGIEDARAAAAAMGINSPAQVDMAFALSKVEGRESTGFKKGEVSAETLNNANYTGMSDAEYRDLGRQLVESGQVNPENLVAEIIREPRALQPWEVTALQFHRTQIESQIFEAQELLESGNEADINKFTFQGINGYKGIAAKMEVINSALFDMEVAMLATANQQSAAFRLRSLMADKDFNVVQYLAEMKARGYVDPQLEAKLKSLSAELNSVRAKLKRKSEEAERLAEQIAQGNIVQAASQPQRTTNRVRTKKATVDALNTVLDAIDISSFSLPGMRFQANNTIRFQVTPNDAVSAAVNDAIAEMKVNVSEGRLSVSDAIEKAVADIDAAVGKNNWDSMKFRSTIANQMVQQSIPLKIKKPYINSDGVLVVPGEYLKSLAQNGQDTIDKMVAATNAELGGSFSEYDIRNAISGYGRQSGEHRSDLQRKIAKARRVANLLSQIEDLETKGKSLKTNKQRHNNDTEINNLREQVRQLEYDLEMTPEERAQLAEQRYHDQRHKYLRNYIDQVQDRINNKDFAPVKHVNRYEDDAETRQLRAEAEKIKNEFKKEKYRHELENRTKWEKWRSLGYDIIFNITRGLSAGADLSALGVQGAIFSAARPMQAAKVLIGSMPGTFSEETYEQYFADMQADPFYEMARKAGLNLQLPNFYQSVQEEQYKGTLPTLMMDFLVGKTARGIATVTGRDADRAEAFATDKLNPFKVGDRNYSLVLSQIRLDLFKEFMTNQINKSGINTQIDDATVKQVAEVVNTITMASKVPGLQGKLANDIISAIMFSARKFVATWKILGGWAPLIMGPKRNPQLFYDAYGRVIGKGLGTMFLAAALPAAIASWMKAADDEEDEEEDPYFYNPYFLDPRHSDFLKIKAGDTRISLFQGIDGNVVFATRMATKEYMTSSSQAVRPLNGEGFNKTRLELSWDYISNKFAPTASIVTRGLQGDREQQEAYERFQESLGPMWLTGVKEQYDNTGNLLETGTLGVLGILGLSYNNYGGAEFAQKRGTNNQKAQAIFDRSGLTAYDPASGQRTYFDGKEVVKATGDVYKKKYLPAYQKFMTEAVVSNEKKLDRGVNWEIKEGLVKKFKSEAYKYAEIKTSGVYAKGNYNSFSSDGTEYRLLESQYPLKAKYINQYMSRDAKRERSSAKREVMQKLRSDGIKPTDGYRDMLIDLYLYNKANSYANEKLISDMNRKKIKLIKKADYTSDMEEAEPETE